MSVLEKELQSFKYMDIKRCPKCDKDRFLSDFYKNAGRCKVCFKEYREHYIKNNKEKIILARKLRYQKNKQKVIKQNSRYKKDRKKVDINYRLADNLRSRLNMAIKKNKAGSAIGDLGCTVEHLKKHLESLFKPGMTWDNWSINGWHIDHIFPLSKLNLLDLDEFKKACHYTNLQPLWAGDNLKKSNKIGDNNE